ncbi:MAG: hypothetical protein HQK51_12915 [Oligoflexia bacterium]|nr:hypothetical protein [Oligoflexia bacterium]
MMIINKFTIVLMYFITILSLLSCLSCSHLDQIDQSLQMIDQSQLNHRAMSLDTPLLPSQKTFLTNLKSIEDSSGGGGCTVCAY